MPRTIPLDRLKDPTDPDPYANYRSGTKPEPPYDTLIVGRDTRQAFKGGVLVDEHTGAPLARPRVDDAVPVTRPRRGRPPKT